jgi:hypothetical protein
MFMLETSVDGNKNIAPALRLGDQLGVRERAPFGFGNGKDFMIRESLPQTGIDSLV